MNKWEEEMDELDDPPPRIPLRSLIKKPSLRETLSVRGWLNFKETARYLGVSDYILRKRIEAKGYKQKGIIPFAHGTYRVYRKTIMELELELEEKR